MSEDKVIVYIYDGYGVDGTCFEEADKWISKHLGSVDATKKLFEVKKVNSDFIRSDKFVKNPPDSLIFPGGHALQYVLDLENLTQFIPQPGATKEEIEQLTKDGAKYIKSLENNSNNEESTAQKNIHSFVENGGIAYGICAGAYYLSRRMLYSHDSEGKPNSFSTIEPSSVVLANCYDSDAVGNPNRYLGKDKNDNDIIFTEVIADHIDSKGNLVQTQFPILKGPFFENEGLDVFTQARYAKAEDQGEKAIYPGKPALIKTNLGKGRVIASGGHPEFSADRIHEVREEWGIHTGDNILYPDDNPVNRQMKQDSIDEFSRSTVLNEIMYKLEHLLEHGRKPDSLPELTDRGLADKLAQRNTNSVINAQQDKLTAKELNDQLSKMDKANPTEIIKKPSQTPKVAPKEEIKAKPLQTPKPPKL